MDTCKHDWFFVNGTDDLKCKRCGEVTGPRTYEERVQDILEYDTTQFYMPTGQLQVANFKPNYNLTFHRDGKEVGKFDFNGPEMIFEGDAAESAKVFVDWVANAFRGRLEEERGAGRQEALAQSEQEPVAYLCENAAGHRYFRWKKPSGMYKPIPLYKRKIEDDTGVTWGIDWGRAGNKSCATIIKRLPGGKIEVVAVEYEP